MRRFTDPILFLALFVLDVIAWAVVAATSAATSTDPGRIAPMTVASVVVIAAPALAVVLLLALGRAIANVPPRGFYTWSLVAAVLSALVTGGAFTLTSREGIEVGLGWMTWFFAIEALAFVVALVMALTKAIPTPAPKDAPTTPAGQLGAGPHWRSPRSTPDAGATSAGTAQTESGRPTGGPTTPGATTGAGADPLTPSATSDPAGDDAE